ncbi:hypothetical protein ACIOWI_30135 [Streptomyces sp. NPDC087659]
MTRDGQRPGGRRRRMWQLIIGCLPTVAAIVQVIEWVGHILSGM